VSIVSDVRSLEEFGRTRLSDSFFMRDFLYSDIAAIFGLTNLPTDRALAIETGTGLCQNVLEPLQRRFGRIAIRSAFRSSEVNEIGNVKKLGCANNESNYARHIWDMRDSKGRIGATACIVIPAIWDRFQEVGDWQKLAWWIHDHLSYSELEFYPRYWACNVTWHDKPERYISSYAEPRGVLTKPGSPNHSGNHASEWQILEDLL
jgi:hypothetical protein